MKKNLLEKLYYQMLRTRMVEQTISSKYSEGKMRCPTHLSIGQEAISGAFSQVAQKKDFAISSHRGHAHYLAKGGNLKSMLSEIYGKKNGCSNGKGGSMHLNDLSVNFMGTTAIVGNSIPIGVGLGLSLKLNKSKHISYIFFGDGAVEEGVFFESINFAVIKKLPVVFICENNLYSVYSPLKVRQPKNRKIYKMVSGLGIKSSICDGNDAVKSFNALKKIENSIKSESSPHFIEFKTYRWLEHCGPNYDNKIGYRENSEFQKWKKKDPIIKLEKKINKKKIELIKKKLKKEISEAFVHAEKSKFPKQSDAYKGIYAK